MPADIDYTAWRFWFGVVQTAGTIIIDVYVWLVNRKKAVEKRFTQLEAAIDKRCSRRKAQIDGLEEDRTALKIQLEYMPTHKDIQKMHEPVAD